MSDEAPGIKALELPIVSLSEDERRRFALYLEQLAESNDILCSQASNLPPAVAQGMITMYERESEASRMISRRLRNTETMSIGTGDGG